MDEHGDETSIEPVEPDPAIKAQVEQITTLVLAKIEQRIDHLHMPLPMPSADQAEALKKQAPEVYDLWLKLIEKKADDDADLARLPFDHPLKLAKRGQWFALAAMILVLALCGYFASLGGPGPYLGGVLGAIDLAGIIGTFMRIVN